MKIISANAPYGEGGLGGFLAAVVEEATICGVTVATATAGETPVKIRSGVSKKPPPTPNMPEMNPTAAPMPRKRSMFTVSSAINLRFA